MSDLISRADALGYPLGFEHYDKENGSREFICGVESYREYIQHLPSVSAERVGEWIGEADGYADGELVYDMWYCSNCDYQIDDDREPTFNYCPNCGAKMKGGNE